MSVAKAGGAKCGCDSKEVRDRDKPGGGSQRVDQTPTQSAQPRAKFMLVDDEREFVDTLSERLSIRDMNTTVAYGGEQALEAVSAEAPDVMVLDLMMPGIDGFEVLHRVKRDHPQVQVVILTGHGSAEDRKTCLAAGAFAFLQKPVDIDELSSVMRRACQQTADEENDEA